MKKLTKSFLCLFLSACLVLSLAGCSAKTEVNEENITEAVNTSIAALKEFDSKALKNYVDSKTLGYIISLADEHNQFAELGKSMFEGLSIEIKSIDVENKKVTVDVKNKDLFLIASNFTYDLTRSHSNLELLSLLNDDSFLDNSLNQLTEQIANQYNYRDTKTVTFNIVEGKRNLIIQVDEEAENAISGGALTAVKSVIS